MSNTVDNCMAAYLGHRDYAMDGMIHFACDAAPKKQMTLQEHLKKYHDGKMPKGRCKFLKQYEKEHPEEFKKAVEASAEEKNVDVANKNAAPKKDVPKYGEIRVFHNAQSVTPYKVFKYCPHNTSSDEPGNGFWQQIGNGYQSKGAAQKFADKMSAKANKNDGEGKKDNGGEGDKGKGKWGMTLEDARNEYIKNAVFGGTESSRRGKLDSMLGGYREEDEMKEFVGKLRKYLTGGSTGKPQADPVTNTLADEIEKKMKGGKKDDDKGAKKDGDGDKNKVNRTENQIKNIVKQMNASRSAGDLKERTIHDLPKATKESLVNHLQKIVDGEQKDATEEEVKSAKEWIQKLNDDIKATGNPHKVTKWDGKGLSAKDVSVGDKVVLHGDFIRPELREKGATVNKIHKDGWLEVTMADGSKESVAAAYTTFADKNGGAKKSDGVDKGGDKGGDKKNADKSKLSSVKKFKDDKANGIMDVFRMNGLKTKFGARVLMNDHKKAMEMKFGKEACEAVMKELLDDGKEEFVSRT